MTEIMCLLMKLEEIVEALKNSLDTESQASVCVHMSVWNITVLLFKNVNLAGVYKKLVSSK